MIERRMTIHGRAGAALVALAALGLLASAQNKPQDQVFRDKADRLRLWNMDSNEFEMRPNGPARFQAQGRPIRGQSKDQNLGITCSSVDALLEPASGGRLLLQRLDARGQVRLTQSPNEGGSQALSTERLTLTDSAAEALIVMPGRFVYSRAGQDDKGVVAAGAGTLRLSPLRDPQGGELRSATLSRSVQIDFGRAQSRAVLTSSSASVANRGLITAVTLPNRFNVTAKDTAKGSVRDLTLSASSGVLELMRIDRPAGDDPLLSVQATGPVKIRLIDTQTREDGGKVVRIIDAEGRSLVYSKAARLMTLTGGVRYTVDVNEPGKEPIGAQGQSDSLSVMFDREGRLLEYRAKSGQLRMEGNPG